MRLLRATGVSCYVAVEFYLDRAPIRGSVWFMFLHYWNMNVDIDAAADTETDMESIWIAFGTGYREYCQFFHKLVKMSRLCMVMLCLFQPSL